MFAMRSRYRLLGGSIFLLVLIYYLYHIHQSQSSTDILIEHNEIQKFPESTKPRIGTVVASQSRENTTWLPTFFPEWNHNIYVADQPSATLSVPKNKGREGMTYLTFIITRSLPEIKNTCSIPSKAAFNFSVFS